MIWTSIEPIHLPDLHLLRGPEMAARAVVPHAPVARITIFWDPRLEGRFSDVFKDMIRSGAAPLEVINVLVPWEPQLLASIAKYVPAVTSFTVRNVSVINRPVELEVITAFTACASSAYH
jgi:hypothetical protein